MAKITPETAPAGARLLLKHEGSSFADPFEAVVVEWSPSGRAVKITRLGGHTCWSESLPRYGVLIEILPPPLEQRIAKACEKLDELE